MSTVEAALQYLIPGEHKPVYYASEAGADAALRIQAEFAEHRVTIHSARDLPSPATLDQQGFALHHQPSEITDFYAPGETWEAVYNEELRQLILTATGGDELLVFDHTLRSDSSSIRGARETREPATVIHNDYTDASAARRIRDLMPQGEAERWLAGRFAIVNAWRSVAGPVLSTPLALCDATSIGAGDLVASERRAAQRVGELELVRWNPGHRWYFYPAMERDEVLLIKTFDSASDGRATRSIHSAFLNPNAPQGAAPRESIESRAIVRFGDD